MENKEYKIVCHGDSLTEGYDINLAVRWSNLLSEATGIEIINSGISGDTTGGMLARFGRMVLDHQPTHVTIMGGTNDLNLNIADEIILGNMLAMTRYARLHNVQAIIGIPTAIFPEGIPFNAESVFIGPDPFSKRVESFQDKLKRFVKEEDLPSIDFSDLPQELFLVDGVHPSEEGQVVMMEKAKAVLEKLLV